MLSGSFSLDFMVFPKLTQHAGVLLRQLLQMTGVLGLTP